MPKAIAKKLKEMNEPNYAKDRKDERARFNELRKSFRPVTEDQNAPINVVIKISSMEIEEQRKLLSLMQDIFVIGKAASKIYDRGEYPLAKTYYCAISNPADLVKTLSSFQMVLYSEDEMPIPESLFWPGGGAMLSETRFTPTGTTTFCLRQHLDIISEAWGELSKRIHISLSMWLEESANVKQDGANNSPEYWRGQAAYRKEMQELISKIDYLSSEMPHIADHMNAWAEAWRELYIERQKYEENNDYDESEDFRYP